jgi:hypothetical protein
MSPKLKMEEHNADILSDGLIVILDDDRVHNSWLTNGKHVFKDSGIQVQLTPAQMKMRLQSSQDSQVEKSV